MKVLWWGIMVAMFAGSFTFARAMMKPRISWPSFLAYTAGAMWLAFGGYMAAVMLHNLK